MTEHQPEALDDRYQNQPWHVRLWRCRHYLPVPYRTLRSWTLGLLGGSPEPWGLPWGLYWSIHVGMAQSRMRYYYTVEETLAHLREVLGPEALGDDPEKSSDEA
jgi:hypothetical protein